MEEKKEPFYYDTQWYLVAENNHKYVIQDSLTKEIVILDK